MRNQGTKQLQAACYFGSVCTLMAVCFMIRFYYQQTDDAQCFTKHYSYFHSKKPPIKIYEYNIQTPQLNELTLLHYTNAHQHNLAHTTVFEHIAKITIERSGLLTSDPNDADLFYVPLYGALYNGKRELADFEKVIEPQLKKAGSYYNRYGGVDHSFIQMLFSHDNIPITPVIQRHKASMFTLGDLDFNYSVKFMRESWRNINFPLTSNIPQVVEPSYGSSRPISTFFIGQIELSGYDELAAPIRKGMAAAMHQIPHSVVINAQRYNPQNSVYNYNFSKMMSNSEFCCVPHGDGPTTKRLFDTFKTLCIPIVLSDEIRFPFESLFVDYSTILMQIPAMKPGMIRYAMNIPSEQKKSSMRTNMIRISKLLSQSFDFTVENGNLAWGWLWVHYFKLATVASVKRRGLLKSKYL